MLALSTIELPNEEHVKHREANTLAYVGNTNLGSGTLYIAQDSLLWCTENGQGLSLSYPSISVHAISRNLDNFSSECLYVLLDEEDKPADASDDEDEEEPKNEVRFVPEDKSHLDAMYQAMCQCQLLHPDPDDSVEEDGDGTAGFTFTVANSATGNGGDADEPMEEDGQFDDAD